MLIRLQKYLADCGLASRRKAEALIEAGQISVNGKIITKLGSKIDPQKDRVSFQNKTIKAKNLIYIKLNKPTGYTCTTRGFTGEKNILQLVNLPDKIFPVGRLDKNTRGLIFLTNDGEWAYQLTHPKFEVEKEYLVRVDRPLKNNDLISMLKGIKDEGESLKIHKYQIKSPTLVSIILTQGHKREIRRLFQHFQYHIHDLIRLRIAKWALDNLPEGQWQEFQP